MAEEINPKIAIFNSHLPGEVDTSIQDYLRSMPISIYPEKDHFIHLKESGLLVSASIAAQRIYSILSETSDHEFSTVTHSFY